MKDKKHTVKEFFYDTRFTDYNVGDYFRIGPSKQRKIVALTIFLVLFIFNISAAFYLFDLVESFKLAWSYINTKPDVTVSFMPILKIVFAKMFIYFNIELIKQIVIFFLYKKFPTTRSGGMR